MSEYAATAKTTPSLCIASRALAITGRTGGVRRWCSHSDSVRRRMLVKREKKRVWTGVVLNIAYIGCRHQFFIDEGSRDVKISFMKCRESDLNHTVSGLWKSRRVKGEGLNMLKGYSEITDHFKNSVTQ